MELGFLLSYCLLPVKSIVLWDSTANERKHQSADEYACVWVSFYLWVSLENAEIAGLDNEGRICTFAVVDIEGLDTD